jgi:HlyD family secretion protein
MKRILLLSLLIPVVAVAWWAYQRKSEPPVVPFAAVRRETLTSTLTTNGKVEPIEWQAVRAGIAGVVDRVPVSEGAQVRTGDTLAVLSVTGLQSELRAAEARVAEARAELSRLERGGPATELAQIQGSLARARNEREVAQREYESLNRLAAKQAATRAEVDAARNRVRAAELEIESLERRRTALAASGDKGAAEARLREAEAAAEAARIRIGNSVVRSPMDGAIYELSARPGSYLNAGDLVANVGRLEMARVRVYVDEPELGRVQVGQPVTITWDALPGRTWQGTVERKPSSVQEMGTRHVGEVLCTIDNAGLQLVPGTNVNAEIRTNVVAGALTIPKEALRRDARGTGVYALQDGALAWRPVTLGASSVTRAQIVSGLKEGENVALSTDVPLEPGKRVTPANAEP